MRSPTVSIVSACVCALIAAAAWGQDAAAPQQTPWKGVVTGSRVYVRAGANLAAYPCATLSNPDTVTVVDETAGWLKILPPAGTFSAVSKDHVELNADGSTGKIVNEDIWVRAGGNLRSTDFWAIQRLIRKGETVKILGTAGRFYKIQPPEGAYFYVSKRYVEPAATQQPATREPVVEPVVQPAVEPKVEPKIEPVVEPDPAPAVVTEPVVTAKTPPDDTISIDAPAPEPEPEPAAEPAEVVKTTQTRTQVEQAVADLNALDAKLLAQIKKPIRNRDFGTLVADYNALRPRIGKKLEHYIDARVKYIAAEKARAEKIREIDDMLESAETQQQDLQSQRVATGVTVPQTAPDDLPAGNAYAATGVLLTSSVYTGTGAMPKRYTLIDPASRTFVGYVQPANASVNLAGYVGKSVGVTGPVTAENGTSVIEAKSIELLGSKPAPAAPAPAPIIKYVPGSAAPAPAPVRPAAPAPAPRGDLAPVPEVAPRSAPAGSVVPAAGPKPAAVIEQPKVQPAPVIEEPKIEPVRPAPVIEKPKVEPVRPAPVIEEPKVEPVRPAPVIEEPKAAPEEVGGVPLIVPKTEPKPPATTQPSVDSGSEVAPLPPTGMPLLDAPGDSGGVDESKYR